MMYTFSLSVTLFHHNAVNCFTLVDKMLKQSINKQPSRSAIQILKRNPHLTVNEILLWLHNIFSYSL